MRKQHRHIFLAGTAITGLLSLVLFKGHSAPGHHEQIHSETSLRETAKATSLSTSSPQLVPVDLKSDPSLSAAFFEARHAVSEVDAEASQLPGNEGAHYFAFNPGQQLSARFLSSSIRIASNEDSPGVTITRDAAGAHDPNLTSHASRVEFRHSDGVIEWWENGASGLEQGFTVPSSSAAGGEVKLSMTLSGMQAFADPERPGDLVFGAQEDAPDLGYRNLKAWDAKGAALHGHMQPTPGGFEITVAANDAVFPITIDPVVVNLQPAILPFAEGTAEATATEILAISGDYAAIGMPGEHTSAGLLGAVYLFEFKKGRWDLATRLLPPLPATEPAWPGLQFGSRICFSGKQLIALSPQEKNAGLNHTGVVHVFTRKNSGWKYDTTIRPPETDGTVMLFGPVAASEDTLCLSGTRAEEATPETSTRCLWIYNRKGQQWLPQQRVESYCYSLAVNGDLIVSGDADDGADVFRKQGTTWKKETRIVDPVTASGTNAFGVSVDVAAGKILVGATWARLEGLSLVGTAHLFESVSGTWQETKRLSPPAPIEQGTQFGQTVRLEGGLAYVGAPGLKQIFTYRLDDDLSAGPTLTAEGVDVDFGYTFAVSGNRVVGFVAQEPFRTEYVNYIEGFELRDNEWRSTGVLDMSFKHRMVETFANLVVAGDRVFVGDASDPTTLSRFCGSVYVFRRNGPGWAFEQKLRAPDPEISRTFGHAIAAIPGRLVVAAMTRTDGSGRTPRIYVYKISGSLIEHEQTLTLPVESDITLATGGDHILVGAPTMVSNSTYSGAVHAFSKIDGTWTFDQTLLPEAGGRFFGIAMVIKDDVAWIGCPQFNAFNPGKVYGFRRSDEGTWLREATLLSPASVNQDGFGASLALSDDTLWAGLPWRPVGGGIGNRIGGMTFRKVNGTSAEPAQLIERPDNTLGSFGTAVKASGDLAVVQSSDTMNAGMGASRLDLYQRSGDEWIHTTTINEPAPASYVGGVKIEMIGDTILSTSPDPVTTTASNLEVHTGLVYAHRITSPLPEIGVFQSGKKKGLATNKTLTIPASATEVEIRIENTGDARLVDLQTQVEGPDAAAFIVSQPEASGLDPQTSTTFTIQIAPGSSGRKNARVSILSNDGDENPFVLPVTHTPRRR